jgi:predicted DNA repair protein MutK
MSEMQAQIAAHVNAAAYPRQRYAGGVRPASSAAMLWVGGHSLLIGSKELGWHAPYDFVLDLEKQVEDVGGVGGPLAWLINSGISAVIGLTRASCPDVEVTGAVVSNLL